MGLAICRSCARHRRTETDACPFCGEREVDVPPARPVLSGASRAALVFGGVALGASFGCLSKGDVYGAPPPPPRDAGTVTPAAPAYGAPPPLDVAPVVTVPSPSQAGPQPPPPPPRDAGSFTPAPPYGAPPPPRPSAVLPIAPPPPPSHAGPHPTAPNKHDGR